MEERFNKIKNRINQDNCFLQSSAMRVTNVSQDEAEVEMPVSSDILNIYGLVHGGAIFSLADTAAGAASFTSGKDSVTLNSSMNFLAGARSGRLFAHARAVHVGSSTGVYEVRITDSDQVLIAVGTFTMYFLEPGRKKSRAS